MANITVTHSDFMGDSRDSYFFQAVCGKREAYVSFCGSGWLTVCARNASHKVFRGAGRTFHSLREALDAYKSAAMRAIILEGVRVAFEKTRGEIAEDFASEIEFTLGREKLATSA